ncbi:hypothetical protein L0F63_000660 [Massospora cicadina]|nr:hypothetical protein L0F63_000660 [Massospora cicadina]
MDEEPSPTFSQHGLRNFRPRTKPFSCYGTYTSTTDKSAQTLDAFTTLREPLRYFQDEDSEDSGEARVAMNIPEPMDANRASDAAWYEKENLRLQKLLNLSNSTVNTLSSELSRAQFHIIELNSRNKESTTKQDDLINKLKSVTLRCIQAERLLQNTSTDNASLTQQLARVEVENERLASEIVLLRKQDFEGWNQSPHRRQVKERASLANAQLESALNDARAGIQALLKGVESAKRVSKILASIDNFYTESNDSCCSSPSGSDPSLST